MTSEASEAMVKNTDNDEEIIIIGDSKIRLIDAINYITKRTDELVFVEEGTRTEREMKIMHIPLIIFGELSERFGLGQIKTMPVALGGDYKMQALDKNNPHINFPGAIGIRASSEGTDTTFALWSRIPKGEPDNVFEPLPIVELFGGLESTRTWAYGKGNLMAEKIRARLPINGLEIHGINLAATRLLALILFRAQQLMLDPTLKPDRFWEADKYPGSYDDPD